MIYTVYKILHNGKSIYIGRTNNIQRRSKEHNRSYKNSLLAPDCKKIKQLYKYLKEEGFTDKIELIEVKSFKSKVESKRYEMLLILIDHFKEESNLKQQVPNISDR